MSKWVVLFLVMAVATPGLAQDEGPSLRGAIDLRVEAESRAITQIDTDVLVVPVFSEEDVLSTILKGASRELAGAVGAAAASVR